MVILKKFYEFYGLVDDLDYGEGRHHDDHLDNID